MRVGDILAASRKAAFWSLTQVYNEKTCFILENAFKFSNYKEYFQNLVNFVRKNSLFEQILFYLKIMKILIL